MNNVKEDFRWSFLDQLYKHFSFEFELELRRYYASNFFRQISTNYIHEIGWKIVLDTPIGEEVA